MADRPKPDCIAIVSGGLDSVTLLHYLVRRDGRRPAVMTFHYGQKHAREVACARLQTAALDLDTHLVLDLTPVAPLFARSALVAADRPIPDAAAVKGDPQPATYVPNRNMLFLALAVAQAETLDVGRVYYGAQQHDLYGYWDTTPDFVDRLNAVYQLNRHRPVQILAPFVRQSKAELLRLGLELGVDYALTWSCYAGDDLACGRCPTCAERLSAFAAVGQSDPLAYAAP